MAKDKLKGITLEIGGDTSELSKALKEPSLEAAELQQKLRAVDQALKFDPDNVELLEQKFRLLSQAIDANEQKLQMLKTAQEQFKASGNDIDSKEYIELERQIALTTNKLEQLRQQKIDINVDTSGVSRASGELDKLDSNIDEADQSAQSLGDTFKTAFSADTLAETGQQIVDTMSNIVDSSLEYNQIMGALEVSGQSLGYTVSQTRDIYNQLYSVLGDTQTAATATSNLQALGLSQEQLRQITEGSIGAWTRYGDSIPIDGLAESINETVKTATVTGNFADVLNWAGTNEDEFNQKLQSASGTTERANIVLQELSDQGLLKSADAFRENNSTLIEYNESQSNLEEETATLGETLTPIFSTLNEAISGLLSGFNSLPGPVQTVITVILGVVAVLTTLSPLILAVQMAVTTLSVPLLPLAGIILGIVAAISAVILIFQNWGAITEWFSNLWNTVWTAISTKFEEVKQAISDGINAVIGFFTGLGTSISETVTSIINSIIEFGSNLITNITTTFSNVVSSVVSFASDIVSKAVKAGSDFVNGIVSFVTTLPSKISTTLSNIISSVASFVSNLASKATEAASRFVSNITSGIQSAVSQVTNIGKNIVQGIWNGISGASKWLLNKVKKFATSVIDGIKGFFGIHSPSTVMEDDVGENLDYGMGIGVEKKADAVLKPIRDLQKEISAGFSPAVNASVQKTLDYNGTITIESPINIDLDGKVVYTNVIRRVTKNQANRLMFQGG